MVAAIPAELAVTPETQQHGHSAAATIYQAASDTAQKKTTLVYSIQVIQGVDRLWGAYAAVWREDEVRRDHSRD